MKVCWLSNYFSPYKVKLFEELSKKIELTVLMLGGKDANRNEEWIQDKNASYKTVMIDSSFNNKIEQLAEDNDVLVDAMYFSLYGFEAVSTFNKHNKKTVLYADGGIAKDRGIILNGLMIYLMGRHDYTFSSSKYVNNYFKYYGVKEDTIFTYRFTSLSNKDLEDNKKLIGKKQKLRNELNIDNKYTFISIGQPIKRKGFDILLNSYIKAGLQDKANLIIIGGSPQKSVKKIVDNNKLVNVKFVDLISSNELKKYYAAADSFILTTREDIWGLVIEEAMSFGLPVITSNNCVAGLHFKDICDGVKTNDVDDIDGYARLMNEAYNGIFSSLNTLKVISEYSIENSARDLAQNLNDIK